MILAHDLREEFDRYGRLKDVWVARNPPGFAFIEFEDDRDARDAVKDMDGRYILDKRVRVEHSRRGGARGARAPESTSARGPPLRTEFRIKITNLPDNLNWRDLKDFLRTIADPVYADVLSGGVGVAEFRSASDADRIVDKLDDTKYEGSYIRVSLDSTSSSGRGRDRSRSRSRDRSRRDRSRS